MFPSSEDWIGPDYYCFGYLRLCRRKLGSARARAGRHRIRDRGLPDIELLTDYLCKCPPSLKPASTAPPAIFAGIPAAAI